jgi:hypothetical protein
MNILKIIQSVCAFSVGISLTQVIMNALLEKYKVAFVWVVIAITVLMIAFSTLLVGK